MKSKITLTEKLQNAWESNLILILAILIYLSLEVPKQNTGLNYYRIIQAIFMTIVVFGHGVKRYGWGAVIFLMLITFGITWTTESVSIITGFPFGNYAYSEKLGTKIGRVPWGIMPAYFLTAYLAWSISTTFLNNYDNSIRKKDIILTPVIASFITVMWDFCFDPIHATAGGAWIWEDGGPFWGVPLSNYAGWFITVYIIFQIFALYLYLTIKTDFVIQNRVFWYIPPLMYIGIALEFLLNPFFKSGNPDIYWSMFLGTVFTMMFTGLLNITLVSRRQGLNKINSPLK